MSLITVVGWAVTVITGIGLIGYGIYKATKSKPNTKFITPPYVPPKLVPKPKVISKVIEVVSPTAATALKLTKAVIDVLPQPCPPPTHKDWNDVSDELKKLAKALGMVGVLNYLLSKVDIIKKYKNLKNHHHIVLKTGNFILGLNTMESARKNIRETLKNSTSKKDAINDERNMVWVHTAVHVHMHTIAYKTSIVLLFNRDLYLQKEGKQKIISRLSTLKEFLKKMDDFFF